MYDLAGEKGLDLDALRARLRRMGERELLRFGQLREAAKEWGLPASAWMNPQEINPLNMRHISTTRQKQ